MKVAIIFSGHLRNILEHVNNLKDRLLDILHSQNIIYDIYLHTWDTRDTTNHMDDNTNVNDIIECLMSKINIKKYNVETQIIYGHNTLIDKTIHNNSNSVYVEDLYNKLYNQYLGIYKALKLIDNINDYDYIIRTRPDCFYHENFDITLFNYDYVCPNSHLGSGNNINQIFFLGRAMIMKVVCTYIKNLESVSVEYNREYNNNDINLNLIFRYYIMNHLKIKPHFCEFNPGLYRTCNNIIMIP